MFYGQEIQDIKMMLRHHRIGGLKITQLLQFQEGIFVCPPELVKPPQVIGNCCTIVLAKIGDIAQLPHIVGCKVREPCR